MQVFRRPTTAGLLVAAVVAALLTIAAPAAADGKHCTQDPLVGGTVGVCLVTSSSGNATAEIVAINGDNFHSPTVALEMCSVGPSNCGIVASASDVGHIWTYFSTSKPYSFGHIYRAIGSWTGSSGARHTAISTGYYT